MPSQPSRNCVLFTFYRAPLWQSWPLPEVQTTCLPREVLFVSGPGARLQPGSWR